MGLLEKAASRSKVHSGKGQGLLALSQKKKRQADKHIPVRL